MTTPDLSIAIDLANAEADHYWRLAQAAKLQAIEYTRKATAAKKELARLEALIP